MRIVLDTNVLVAGLLSPFGPPADIVRMASSGEVTLCLDARLMSEYRDVFLRPKFGFDEDSVAALLDFLQHRGLMCASSPLAHGLPEPDEAPFLEVALACDAHCLVTGSLVHFPEDLRQGTEVLSPGEFVQGFGERRQRVGA